MGGGCSRPPTKRAKQAKTNPPKKAVVPSKTSKVNLPTTAAKGQSLDRQPLCRTIGFATSRAAPINGELGSKGSRVPIRSNSYWLHEDDDRVDAVINRWKSSEIFLLQGLFQECLLIQRRSKIPVQVKGRNHQSHTAIEGPRLPVDTLILAMTSRKMFIAGSGSLLGIAFSVASMNTDYEDTAEPPFLLSPSADAIAQSNHFMLPPLIIRLDPSQNDVLRCNQALSSPYVCEPATAESPASLPYMRFTVSSQSGGQPRKVSFSKLERCIPIWGLTGKGLYQALCVQTLAISVSPLTPLETKLKNNSNQQRNRIFHFHMRKCEGSSESDTKRDKVDEDSSHLTRSLSLDFKDFGRAVAIMGGKGTREEMLILLFLLFAESASPAVDNASKDPDGAGVGGGGTGPSGGRSCYNDSIGCSSPRDISLTVGSPRVPCTNTSIGEKDDVGEVLALTKIGLDCMVRFLIVSQAVAADSSEAEDPVILWANSILHLESVDCQDSEDATEKLRYSFSVQSEAREDTMLLASCSGGHFPLTLPFFLASLNVSNEGFDNEKDNQKDNQNQLGDIPFHVIIPNTKADVAATIFCTASIAASLNIFVEDIKLTESLKDNEREKGHNQQAEGINTFTAMNSTGELKEEADVNNISLSPAVDSGKEVCFTNANSSSHNKPKMSIQTGGSSDMSSTARKNRKSHLLANQKISPSSPILVPVPFDCVESSHEGILLLPNDLDDCSVGSGGTLSGDSTGNVDLVLHSVGGKTASTGLNAWLPLSSGSGISGGNTQDGIVPSRSRSLTVSASQPIMSRNEFASSACGLNNLGNTCFMSSALQCFIHSPLLKEYFLSGKYKEHLNPKNPLGTKGALLTRAFASLIESMASKTKAAAASPASASFTNGSTYKRPTRQSLTPTSSSPRSSSIGSTPPPGCVAPSFAPHEFRRDLQSCKSQFQGHEQQDVQEFLAELMDALHEDLNRHTKYSAPATGIDEETPPNPVATRRAKASGWQRLLIGQSAKRVLTVNTISNASVEKDLEKEEEGDIEPSTVTKSADSAIALNPASSPQPMSVEMQGTAAWEQHLVRNRSCIVDLFQGQLCSAVTCNVCGNVSRTFDPFTSLSLPLPVQHDITVMVTMFRRMPRLSTAAVRHALGREGYTKAAAIIDEIHAAQMMASQPIRMVIVLPRLSDMSDLRKAICQMLSPAAPKNSSSSSSSSSHTSAENGSTTAPYTLLPENLMLLDCFRTVLDDRESILQLIESISRSAATTASMRTDSTAADSPVAPGNYPDNRTTKGQNVRHRSDSSSMSSPAAADSLKRSDSAATKMTQETSSGMTLHCVAVENPKDIPFIFSLSPSRLGSRGARSTPPANFSLSPAGASTDKLILNGNGTASDEKPDKSEGSSHNTSAFNPNFYSDELEYQEGSIDPTEGDVVADIDFDAPNSQKQTGGEKVDDKTGKRKKDAAWPSSIEGLMIGRRVDAKDLAGQWCSGTVMDRWKVTAEELLELSTERSHMSTGNGNGMSSSNPACSKVKRRGSDDTTQLSRQGSRTTNMSKEKDRNKGPRTAGWNVRINFDGVSDRWDEWFSALDFEQRLARIYSQKNRRLKVVQLAVVQRQITLRDSPRSAGSQSSPDAGQTKTFSVKVFGYPIMLQCESFRSCEHIYRVIAEQSIRYASPNQMRQMVESSVHRAVTNDSTFSEQSQSSSESSSLPFSIRIISTTSTPATDNLEGFDMDLGLIRVDERGKAGVPRRARARPPIPNGRSKSTDGLKEGDVPPYSSIWDRANGFQSWEGSYFPRDPFRPICNLIHDSLLVAVDWHWNSTNAPTSGQGKGSVNFRDHESYSKYIATQIPPSIPMVALDTPKKIKEENHDQNGSATLTSSSATATDLAQPVGHNARTSSSSAHPSLVDCLRSFTGTEELDEGSWHCDHCKKLSSGSVSSSLSRLPDLLIMHIKRFGMTARFREKIREKVIFPLTSLDMKPFVNISAGGDNEIIDDSRYLYDLYAVANHLGGMSGGHYTAMVKCNAEVLPRPALNGNGAELSRSYSYDRNPPPSAPIESTERPDAAWMCFDDDVVTAIPAQALEATIVSETAYVLFYKRRQLTSSNIVNLCP